MSLYVKNIESSQINNLILLLKLLEKQDKLNPKQAQREEIIKNIT
jgi:hypothetical protein